MSPVRWTRLALFGAALVVRLLAVAATVTLGWFPDLWEYEVLARNLLAGRGFTYPHMNTVYHAYVEPLYPFLVAGVYGITGFSVLALAGVQCVLSALLVLVIHEFGRRTFGEKAALAAAGLVALHPALVGYATKFHPLVLDALLFGLVGLTMLRLLQAPAVGRALLLGLALGAAALTRPTILAFLATALVTLPWTRWGRRAVPHVLLGMVCAALVLAPWTIRNYVVLGSFVLTRTNTPFVLWLGNNPAGSRSLFELAPPDLQQRILATDEVTQNRIFLDEAVRHITADPLAFAGRTLTKLGFFWSFPPYGGRLYRSWQVTTYLAWYLVTFALAVAGAWAAWRQATPGQRLGVWTAGVMLASISIAQAIFYIEGRHRLSVEAFLLVFSGHGAAMVWQRLGLLRLARTAGARA